MQNLKKLKKNRIYLDFCISNFEDISHDNLSDLIGLQPTYVHIKGNKQNPQNKYSQMITVNNWFLSSGINEYLSFDEHMDTLLSVLESKLHDLKPICKKYSCSFICAFYIYKGNGESTPWVDLGDRYNQLISNLNASFDLDIYVF